MPGRKGPFPPQNHFLDTISTRFNDTHSNFVLGSAKYPGKFPIVYCSDGFCDLTGFQRLEVIQQCSSCDFLYGENTPIKTRISIMNALQQQEKFQTELILYNKSKECFRCLLDIVPINNDNLPLILVSHKNLPMRSEIEQLNHSDLCISPFLKGSCSTITSSEAYSSAFKQHGNRRRSRAVLYTLSEKYDRKNQRSFLKCFNKFGQQERNDLAYKFSSKPENRFTILHFGMAKTTWDWFIMLATVYVAVTVPYNAAVQAVLPHTKNATNDSSSVADHHSNFFSQICDISVEIAFIVDIILTFRTTYVNNSGFVIRDVIKIAKQYVKTWFFVDLIAALPVDIISHLINVDLSVQPMPMLKLVRLMRFGRLLNKIGRWSEYGGVMLVTLMLVFGIIAHCFACLWLFLGWREFQYQPDAKKGWVYELSKVLHEPFSPDGSEGPDIGSSYITSLYFILSSLTSVGFGNVSANTNIEKCFSICVMTIGALMHALVFGNVTAIIQRMYAKRSNFQDKMIELKDFIKLHRLPKSTKERMINYFQHTWKFNGGINANKLLKNFPADIRADVTTHIYKHVLNIPTFQRGSQALRRYLSLHIQRRKVVPGEHIVYEGDPLLSLNYVCSGIIEVRLNGETYRLLGKGEFFGADVTVPRHQNVTSEANVCAVGYCELECISMDGIRDILITYPDFAPTFIEIMNSGFISCNLGRIPTRIADFDLSGDNTSENESSLHEDSDLSESEDAERNESIFENCFYCGNPNDESSPLFAKSYPKNDWSLERHELSNPSEDIEAGSTFGDKNTSINHSPVIITIEPPQENSAPNINQEASTAITMDSLHSNYTEISNESGSTKKQFLDVERALPFPKFLSSDHNFNTSFTKKANSASDISSFHEKDENLRPSCFKKSLLSLDSASRPQRIGRSSSDAGSVTKRVTFFDDPGMKPSIPTRRFKRSISVSVAEKGRGTLALSPSMSNSSRRHSDVAMFTPKQSEFSLTKELLDNRCDSSEAKEITNNSHDLYTTNKENGTNYALTDETKYVNSLTPEYHFSSCISMKPSLLRKTDYVSPYRATRRRRRQRRKPNSSQTKIQCDSMNAESSHEELKSCDDTNDDTISFQQLSDDTNDVNQIFYSNLNWKLSPSRSSSVSNLITANETAPICMADQYIKSALESYVQKLQEITIQMNHLNSEIQKLPKDMTTSIPSRFFASSNESINHKGDDICSFKQAAACNSHLHASTNNNVEENLIFSKTSCSMIQLEPAYINSRLTSDLNNMNVNLNISQSAHSETKQQNNTPEPPLCIVTAPSGETNKVIDDSQHEATDGYVAYCAKTRKLSLPLNLNSFEFRNRNVHDKLSKMKYKQDNLGNKDLKNCIDQMYANNEVGISFQPKISSKLSSQSFAKLNFNNKKKEKSAQVATDSASNYVSESCKTKLLPSNGVFLPIHNEPSCDAKPNFEDNRENHLLLFQTYNAAKGSESGYMSASPTMHL